MNYQFNYTFIIPHHNCPDLLRRCLDSIPKRDDLQIIVVDDASDEDKLPSEIRTDVEMYYISKTETKGAGHARNIGLSHAYGKWIIFADADDFFVSDLEYILDKYLDETSDIIYFNIKSCYSDNPSVLYHDTKDKLFDIYNITGDEKVFRIGYTEPWGKLIRKQLLDEKKIVFQETRANNDFLFSVKSGISAKTIQVVNKPIYWYVFRIGSLGNSIGREPLEKSKDRLLAFCEVEKVLKDNHVKTRLYLPSIPARYFFYHNIRGFVKSIQFMKSIGINFPRLYIEIFFYMIKRILHIRQYEIYECFYYNKKNK